MIVRTSLLHIRLILMVDDELAIIPLDASVRHTEARHSQGEQATARDVSKLAHVGQQ